MLILGIALFALCLLLSIAWHECGHMWAAQATGMKVRRYFVGFGPKIWSFRRGETEYGIKAIPLGGFCDIAGMTTYDELAPEDESRAMYRQKPWKRLVVLFAGPLQNFILAFILIVGLAIFAGLPNLTETLPAKIGATQCVAQVSTYDAKGNLTSPKCTGGGPAADAGLRDGDKIVAINGQPVSDWDDVTSLLKNATGAVAISYERDGVTSTTTMQPVQAEISTIDEKGNPQHTSKPMVGISPAAVPWKQYNVVTAFGGAAVFTGQLIGKTWDALLQMPSKVSALWHAITGGSRSADTPTSVVGASVIGGQAADHGAWSFFFFLLASINLFLGLFNLIPLLPLDGGHMAVVGYEKIRDRIRAMRGRGAGGPVDYMKLMPPTYAVIAVMGAYMVLALLADIINPIKVF